MPLVGTVLWYKNRPSDHGNHLHVEPPTRMVGIPPLSNPGMTDGVQRIYDALTAKFGRGAYFLDVDHHWEPDRFVIDDPNVKWTHMGGYNRRKIAGSTTWSQHSWWNALDIGPYYDGDQDRFYEFLTNYEGDEMVDRKTSVGPNPVLAEDFDQMREHKVYTTHTDPGGIVYKDELAAFLNRHFAYVVKPEIASQNKTAWAKAEQWVRDHVKTSIAAALAAGAGGANIDYGELVSEIGRVLTGG